MKTIVQFFKKISNFFKMYNRNIRQQLSQQNQITQKGKELLQKVVDEFNKLDAPSSAICRLVDNDEKVIIKLLGVWAVIGFHIHSENLGVFTIYAAKTWASDWEKYTIPVDQALRFDKFGNLRRGETPFMEPEQFGFDILDYVLKIGKNYTPDKIS